MSARNFNAKNFFLTYPRCPVSANVLLEHLKQLSTPRGVSLQPTYIRVCQETHQDGFPHLHALFCLPVPYRASERFFDYQGYHPNIQGARSVAQVKVYLEKGGQYVEWGTSPDNAPKRTYSDILSTAANKDEFWELIKANYPRDAILCYERVMAFADYHFKPPAPVYVPTFTDFTVPNVLQDWYANSIMGPFNNGQRRLSLILISPSRYGKTEWARSLGRHLYFNSMFDLSRFSHDVDYAVFDDFLWDNFVKFHKQWLGAQKEFTLTDKYRKKMTVTWGKPCIFLCNEDNVPPSSDWMLSNCVFVRLNSPLF